MKKIFVLTAGILLISFSVKAQEKTKQSSLTNNEAVKPDYSKKQNVFKSSESTSNSSLNKEANQSLLQELYLIEDERNRIEKNDQLSSNERSNQIDANNQLFISKKEEFKAYILAKGFTNVSKKEQNYYLSILKSEGNKEEYNKNINLIKN